MSDSYSILNADTVKWLDSQANNSLPNVLSGIPDMTEINYNVIEDYVKWCRRLLTTLFKKTNPYCYVILIQTDRKIDGMWLDKSTMINNIATDAGWNLLWHKIVLNRPVESANLHRPTYSHMLCYGVHSAPGNGLPDVIEGSERLYNNGSSINAVKLALTFLSQKQHIWSKYNKKSHWDIVDPFLGRGTVMFYAVRDHGFRVLGIDIDPDQVKFSKELMLKIKDQ